MNIQINRRRAAQGGSPAITYLITEESNKPVYDVCVAKGWCSSDGMSYEDAANVTSISGNDFSNEGLEHFEEFKYFGISTLPTYAFNGNTNLQYIELPAIDLIGNRVFQKCNLAYLDIPDSVITISTAAFIGGNANMQYIIVRGTTPPSIQTVTGYTILSSTNNCPVYVPDASVNAYKTAWSDVASRIYPLSEFVEPQSS